jgi:hypothetical protein
VSTRAALGSLGFFVLAPGSTAGLVPWLITGWHSDAPAWAAVVIAGQAVMFASWGVVVWLVVFVAAVTTFVRVYEEPTLRRTYGPSYDAYPAAVRRWLPRLRRWRGP